MNSRPTRTALSILALALAMGGCSAPQASDVPASLEELASRSLAQLDGELALPGLREPVEVIRDEFGIPHIYAQNDDDLFRAQGYVMAQDRLWQMEMWRRWHEGRLAEVFGPEALPYDRRSRLMMFRGPFDESEWTSYHPDAERIFTVYAEGVNAYIEENRDRLPLEFALTGIVPDPWTAETVVLRWAALAVPSVPRPCDQRGAARAGRRPLRGRGGETAVSRRTRWDDLVVPGRARRIPLHPGDARCDARGRQRSLRARAASTARDPGTVQGAGARGPGRPGVGARDPDRGEQQLGHERGAHPDRGSDSGE